MSDLELTGRVMGVERTLDRLVLFPRRIMGELAPTVRRLGERLQSEAAARAPRRIQGGGRLQRSMKLKIMEGDEQVSAQVFPGTRYGFILSAGTNKQWEVSAHTRRIPQGTMGAYVATKSTKTRTRVKFKISQQGIEFVKAYTRRVHIDPNPYLKNAYQSLKGEILSEIDSAIARGKRAF